MSDLLVSCEGDLSLNLSGAELCTEEGTLALTIREGGCGRTRRTAPVDTLRNLRILADASTLEIFVNDGETVLTAKWYPEDRRRTLALEGRGRVTAYDLQPMNLVRSPAP